MNISLFDRNEQGVNSNDVILKEQTSAEGSINIEPTARSGPSADNLNHKEEQKSCKAEIVTVLFNCTESVVVSSSTDFVIKVGVCIYHVI